MIAQFNLLPDVKQNYIRAERTKRTVMLVSASIAGTCLGLFLLLLFGVTVVQKNHLNHLSKDIASNSAKLAAVPEINKILTVQNQLLSLPGLHEKKPEASRLFTYLGQVTPQQASISKLDINYDDATLTILGTADSLQTVNKFVDTLKFATYTEEGQDSSNPAFSDVVLSNFGRATTGASYQINLSFDHAIFDSNKQVTLTVPNIITTRSQTEKPNALFNSVQTEGQ